MSELPLDDDEWHALVRHLDSVRVPQLVGREPSPYARLDRGAAQLLRAEDDSH